MANTLKSEGYSLWLVPPVSSSLFTTIQTLIHTSIPSIFSGTTPPQFAPHVTLTAGTIHLASNVNPGEWLKSLRSESAEQPLHVTVKELHVGEIFFQKLIMLCEKNAGLCDLATYCRSLGTGDEDAAKGWVRENYRPHCSLMYSEMQQDDVRAQLDNAGRKIQTAKQESPDARTAKGAEVWLVPTFKAIADWQPVAKLELPEIEWTWITGE